MEVILTNPDADSILSFCAWSLSRVSRKCRRYFALRVLDSPLGLWLRSHPVGHPKIRSKEELGQATSLLVPGNGRRTYAP